MAKDKTATDKAATDLVPCDACGHKVGPSTVERTELEGVPVVMCKDGAACRRRAESAGVWEGRARR